MPVNNNIAIINRVLYEALLKKIYYEHIIISITWDLKVGRCGIKMMILCGKYKSFLLSY
jgi:hypothetical protein